MREEGSWRGARACCCSTPTRAGHAEALKREEEEERAREIERERTGDFIALGDGVGISNWGAGRRELRGGGDGDGATERPRRGGNVGGDDGGECVAV